MADTDQDVRDRGVWFQSGTSGGWYQNHLAAGTVIEVRVDGVRFHPASLDAQDDEATASDSIDQKEHDA